ncbi:paxneb protein [Plectosphaerella cucumerina]|uniref:Elongator complex protein 4 n=1 Tax=Plectosphaerella cucumerina TaxID=40658 RepID=A0A8K0WYF5_9PEZI|nr:paxneb protein [Plectosphaerella cucumerina]
MSFRKKNVVLGAPSPGSSVASRIVPQQEKVVVPGVRPSPLDGRTTTSTGTASLDQYLAGHAGFPIGTSLLIEEHGTTDFAGVLLKYYAAEGLVQGHHVHVLGLGEGWRAELPGLAKEKASSRTTASVPSADKMKIAWRYETLNRNGGRAEPDAPASNITSSGGVFCHSFDLASRLDPKDIKGQLHSSPSMSPPGRLGPGGPPQSALKSFIGTLAERLKTAPPGSVHRVVVPTILSPTLYDPSACRPSEVLQVLHGLRGLLRQYPAQLTAVVTLPVTLYPRTTGLTRWMEILSDGVLELIPLSQPVHTQPNAKPEDAAQGMVKVHRLPIYSERGGGKEGKPAQEDLSFKLSSSSGLVIRPFSLPPVGEVEGEQNKTKADKKAEGLAF